jgi:predicted RNA-binding Zn-ribbon protein involved in translation (DUF1610 family)
MSPIRIYADFNGLVTGPSDSTRTAVVLDTFGSLRDLSNAGVILHQGIPLIAVDWSDDDEDLEGHGTAQYDFKRKWWVVVFDDQGVRYVPAGDRSETTQFLCVSCRNALPIASPMDAFQPDSCCPNCGTNLLAAYAPPELAT